MSIKFGKKIKHLREKHGLTQQQLGEALGLSDTGIHQYEAGKREPNFNNLQNIKEFFNVSYEFLLEDAEEDQQTINKIEMDIVDLMQVLRKNYIIVNGKRMSEEAKEGLIKFLKNI